MCGRVACALCESDIVARLKSQLGDKRAFLWQASPCLGDYTPSFNKAPGSFNPVLISPTHVKSCDEDDSAGIIQVMRWGLIASFVPNAVQQASSSSKFATANARAEGILQRPSYRDSFKHGRMCVVVTQGFYEWARHKTNKKQPYFACLPGESKPLVLMAGVFSVNKEQTLYSYSIITTEAVNEMASIHDRMPVIFSDPEDVFDWLNSTGDSVGATLRLLQNLVSKLKTLQLQIHPVTPLMNSTAFDCHQCVEPLADLKPLVKDPPHTGKIDKFFVKKVTIKREKPETDDPSDHPPPKLPSLEPYPTNLKPENH
ncbi:unnamed protein product [Mesocestoides corti]|uniref:Abasic site processing protein HMCES n=1 Tax=Mesocestoides corti TaxID=53468 RepID=A0A0R3UL62_MESCO|nr:unnamed protein product [Mesocestoides corti]